MRRTLAAFDIPLLFFSCSPGGSTDQPQPANAIFVIVPYSYEGTWVFDDPQVGLVREPFVFGIPEMIDTMVQDIPDATEGFRLVFSASPFPDYDMKIERRRQEQGGHWYYCKELDAEGWLCPALFKYFEKAPDEIYAKAQPASPKLNEK